MGNKTLDLLQKRAALYDTANSILGKAQQAGRDLTPAEKKDFEGLLAKMQPIAEQLGARAGLTDIAAIGDNVNSPVFRSAATMDTLGGSNRIIGRDFSKRDYRGLFGANQSTDGWDSFEDFVRAINAGVHHPQLRTMSEGVPSDGGFLTPTEYASEIFNASLESEIVRHRARIYPMSSNALKIPAVKIGNHSSNLYGGVVGRWANEAATLSQDEPKFRELQLTAQKLTCYAIASNEVAEDGVRFEDTLGTAFIQGLGWYLDRAFLKGTGSGQPDGILNAACLVTQAKETAQAAATINYTNLTKMLSRLHSASFGNSVWIAHQTCIPALLSLTVVVGTGGSHIPVLTESGGQFRILTRPVIFTEKTAVLGTVGDIMLCDFSQYAIGMRRELRLEKSNAPHFQTDQTDWRCITRVDGQALWDQALTLEDGSTTVSPFVALATRA